jgi:phosphoglycolate phosphatase
VSFPFAIFDIDGTLVDSRAIIMTCMDAAFVGAGLPAPGYEKTRRIIGLSLPVGLRQLAPDADETDHKRILDAYRDAFFTLRQDPAMASPLYDGAAQLLNDLAAAGWTLGIATGKSRRGLDAMMEQFGWHDQFAAHFCADDGPGKPHPHMVLENIRVVGADPARSIVIGDSEHDMAMAVAAGANAVGVTWGFGTEREMLAAGADTVVETMGELQKALVDFHSRATLGSNASEAPQRHHVKL